MSDTPSPRDVLFSQLRGSIAKHEQTLSLAGTPVGPPTAATEVANAAALMMRGIQRELREEKRRLDDLIQEIDGDIARIKKLARVSP